MDYEVSIDIDAPAELVWAEMSDVERWPESTRSISSVRRLDRGPFGLGSRARVKQPRFTPLVWTVTHFEEGHSFSWQTKAPGALTIGRHTVTPREGNTSTVTLGISQTGALAGLMELLYGGLTRRYVNMEAQGLKRVCEAKGAAAAAA